MKKVCRAKQNRRYVMGFKAVIFDLDGVIVSTDEHHYRAWKKVADEEAIYFDDKINMRLRGVSRMESLEIVLEKSQKQYSKEEKLLLAERKNSYYLDLIKSLTPDDILPGVIDLLSQLKENGIKIAIGSSSKNSPEILSYIGLGSYFDATVDGNNINNSKPHPEVFLKAAVALGHDPQECIVVEDAASGVAAALAAGMQVIGVGSAATDKNADYTAKSLEGFNTDLIIK